MRFLYIEARFCRFCNMGICVTRKQKRHYPKNSEANGVFICNRGLKRSRSDAGIKALEKEKPRTRCVSRLSTGCGRRIWTLTNRVRVCRATITQFRKIFSFCCKLSYFSTVCGICQEFFCKTTVCAIGFPAPPARGRYGGWQRPSPVV